MKIGDKVWIKDINSRVYPKGSNTPTYRGYFVERYIIGETTQSWILGYSRDSYIKMCIKYKKKSELKQIWTSIQEIEDECWIDDNCRRISVLVGRCGDINILKTIDNMFNDKGE